MKRYNVMEYQGNYLFYKDINKDLAWNRVKSKYLLKILETKFKIHLKKIELFLCNRGVDTDKLEKYIYY